MGKARNTSVKDMPVTVTTDALSVRIVVKCGRTLWNSYCFPVRDWPLKADYVCINVYWLQHEYLQKVMGIGAYGPNDESDSLYQRIADAARAAINDALG